MLCHNQVDTIAVSVAVVLCYNVMSPGTVKILCTSCGAHNIRQIAKKMPNSIKHTAHRVPHYAGCMHVEEKPSPSRCLMLSSADHSLQISQSALSLYSALAFNAQPQSSIPHTPSSAAISLPAASASPAFPDRHLSFSLIANKQHIHASAP